jgi:hypothetical protein
LSYWFQIRWFLCEFPIGSYVKLSSAVQPYWSEGGTTRHNFGRGPSNDYFIKVWFHLSNWFQTRFLCEFPIGSYVKHLSNSICVMRFVIHTVRENTLTVNCSLIFKPRHQCIVHLFFSLFFHLRLRQGSFTRKVRTIFILKIIVSIFVKLFLILVLHLRQFFIVIIFVKRATDYKSLILNFGALMPLSAIFQLYHGDQF